MKRKLLIAALFVAAIAPAAAQQQGDAKQKTACCDSGQQTKRFWTNWFVSAGGGAQLYFGDHNSQCDVGDRLGGAFNVALGKWFTPGFGVRFEYSWINAKGATQHHAHDNGQPVPGKGGHGYWLYQQKFAASNLHADVLFNASSLFFGYNEKRVWNVTPYLGIGWGHVGEAPKDDDVTANVGVISSWHLCDGLNLNLDLRGTLVNDDFDGEEGGRGCEGWFTAAVGLSYTFQPRGWKCKSSTRYSNTEINALNQRVNQLTAEAE